MRIGVIGSGNVGGTLGRRWSEVGHEVIFGLRDLQSQKAKDLLKSSTKNLSAATVREAVARSEVVILSVPWAAARDAVEAAGELEGKILVDCTNPLAEDFKGLSIGFTTSAGELIAGWTKGARVVKAFNNTGWQNMANPLYGPERVTMFLCGDDAKAKRVVIRLAEDLGFEACDSGPLFVARCLEPLAMLWITLAYGQGLGPNIAFKILRR
jgi:8-hydroxy-5-deazaflavin:NADPH oxidoreductase